MYAYTIQSSKLLVAATTQTLLQYQPGANHPFMLNAVHISFDGSAAAAGINVELVTQTTAGTGAASPPTPRAKNNNVTRAAQGTVTHNHTAEPTLGGVILAKYIPPFAGFAELQWPMLQELLFKEGGDRLGLRVITPGGVAPNAKFSFEITE